METPPVLIKKQINEFHIDPFTRTYTNENGKTVYWGYDYVSDTKNLTSFIRKLRKKIDVGVKRSFRRDSDEAAREI